MKRINLILIAMLLGTFATASVPALAAAGDCEQAVRNRDYSAVISVCIELPDEPLARLEALANSDYEHHLGTIEEPTQAFATLKTHAVGGDVDAQYLYGILYSMIHVVAPDRWEDGAGAQQTLDQYNARVRTTASAWTRRAANQGHTLAMLDLAEYHLFASRLGDRDEHLAAAKDWASQAALKNEAAAAPILEKVERSLRQTDD